jgi:hypothetical protein
LQHLRSRLGRIRVLTTTLLLGAAVALSGCGAVQGAGAAAIVDGNVVSDQDVQTVSLQVNEVSPEGQKINPSGALVGLMLAPYILAEDKTVTASFPASDARKELAKLAEPSPATVEYIQAVGVFQRLDDASKDSIMGKVGKAKITVNPRYGTFVASPPFLVPNSPNWLKTTATPQPSATPPS